STGGTTPVLTVFLAYLVISDAILIKLMGPDPRHSHEKKAPGKEREKSILRHQINKINYQQKTKCIFLTSNRILL
ncbi:hypothetical protein ACLBWS_17595, partial [Brucellaceae bacterium D45D]